ncbi:cell-envelope stress modulator CpxP [Edwardsiella tarda]|uniref:cell-envelope stress modulator CpxP n=1 Tax=Edwardsiella tarda TaxID=636 RepID=UPI00063BD468|nr:cell-envelope stress modulator CpxP [Edwardsiella tarda]AKH87674.1 cell-envelope stress modulator CpxP [Edwardsiella tarda]
MQKTATLTMAALLTLTSVAVSANEGEQISRWHQGSDMMQQSMDHNHMFDGVSLTEHQRQQMRDLMQTARHGFSSVNLHNIEAMHRLMTAEKFDASAVRALAEKMAQESVDRQVEMARIRNLMFNLLTPEQKAQLNARYQQRVAGWQQQIAYMQNTSAQK